VPLNRWLDCVGLAWSASVLVDICSLFREVPGVTPVAAVGAKFHRRIGSGDLVLGCGEGGAFGGVFALAANRHLEALSIGSLPGIPIIGYRVAPSKTYRVNLLK
jgi:hypothetical protein